MTAVNVLVTKESATIVTDTLAIQPGRGPFHTAKTFALPHMRIAIAARGTTAALTMFARVLSINARDYDTARAYLAGAFRSLRDVAYEDVSERSAWEHGVEIFVAGWGKTGAAAFVISTENTGGEVQDIPYLVCTPVIPSAEFGRLAADPIANMPAILSAQARVDVRVGGTMNVTQVTEDAIVSYTAGKIASPKRAEAKLPANFAQYLAGA